MIKSENVEQRNIKIIQQRYGISVVYNVVQNNALYKKIYECTKKIDSIFQNYFIWYPRWHMTMIRCESVKDPFEINEKEKLYRKMIQEIALQPKMELRYIYSQIGSDGVIRSYYSKINWNKLCAVQKFYNEKNLRYTMIENPWIALGNIRIGNIENVKRNIDSIKNIIDGIDIPNICIDKADFVYYEDILLDQSKCIGKIKLGERKDD